VKKQSIHHREVLDYCGRIITGKIPAGDYAKKAVKRFLADLKREKDAGFLYRLVPEKADEVIDFAESLFIPDIQKKLTLLPWHKFVYYNLFGFVYKNDLERRRFRQGYVEVARKNSKTTSLLFPLILYDFLTTPSAESYLVSKDAQQSEKSFRELKQIIKADPALSSSVSETIFAVTCKTSRIAFFSSESTGIDGYKNSLSIIDEYHAFDSDRIVTSFRYGGRARKNLLELIITSAGTDISKPCYVENEKARKVLNGLLTDETYFALVYAYDGKDDWQKPENLIKANPSMGIILKPEILLNDLYDAVSTPSHRADFKAKTCGIWSSEMSGWIPVEVWDTERRNTSIDIPAGSVCCGGLDLSSVSDFTAYSRCFKTVTGYAFLHRFYIPVDQVAKKYKVENINLPEWIEQGFIIPTPGPTVDYDFILRDIIADAEQYRLQGLFYDRWNANQLITRIEQELPDLPLTPFNQSLGKMGVPVKNYEKAVLDDRIIDPNPVMKWMIGNAEVRPDVNGNYKPLKPNPASTKRIDGVVSSIMALEGFFVHEGEDGRPAKNFEEILRLF
jgi:phage terminase large subunit-like protein